MKDWGPAIVYAALVLPFAASCWILVIMQLRREKRDRRR